jgi:hypothetical protein
MKMRLLLVLGFTVILACSCKKHDPFPAINGTLLLRTKASAILTEDGRYWALFHRATADRPDSVMIQGRKADTMEMSYSSIRDPNFKTILNKSHDIYWDSNLCLVLVNANGDKEGSWLVTPNLIQWRSADGVRSQLIE